MGKAKLPALLAAVLALTPCCLTRGSAAEAISPSGTWLVGDRFALDVAECNYLYCGRIVWLRPGEPGTCGQTIVWGLTEAGPGRWNDGWFFDPDTGQTDNLSMSLRPDGSLSAKIVNLVQLAGKIEKLTPIDPKSLKGAC
jgi:uncharacterized protein (DUF2147 family)